MLNNDAIIAAPHISHQCNAFAFLFDIKSAFWQLFLLKYFHIVTNERLIFSLTRQLPDRCKYHNYLREHLLSPGRLKQWHIKWRNRPDLILLQIEIGRASCRERV